MIIVTQKRQNKYKEQCKRLPFTNLKSTINLTLSNREINSLNSKDNKSLEFWRQIGATQTELEWLSTGIKCNYKNILPFNFGNSNIKV